MGRARFPYARDGRVSPLEADANLEWVGKAREDGKLTVARQAGLYNPEIKGVLYPEGEGEGGGVDTLATKGRGALVVGWEGKRRCSLGGRSSEGGKGKWWRKRRKLGIYGK